jgi:hypothetical protein
VIDQQSNRTRQWARLASGKTWNNNTLQLAIARTPSSSNTRRSRTGATWNAPVFVFAKLDAASPSFTTSTNQYFTQPSAHALFKATTP